MSDAIGSKNMCKTCSTEFFDWRVQSNKSSFSTGSASRNSQSKKVESKKTFFDCVRKPDLGFSRKRPFSTDKSDCIRNGLRKSAKTRPVTNPMTKRKQLQSPINGVPTISGTKITVRSVLSQSRSPVVTIIS